MFSFNYFFTRNHLKYIFFVLTAFVGVVLIAAPLDLLAKNTDAPPVPENKTIPSTATQVTSVVASTANWPVSISTQGEVVPWEIIMLSAKTNGVGATEISVLEGERVQKGQLLARFDDRLLRAELAQARANLAFAEADLQQAKTHLKRAETLKQKQTLSEQEFDLIATRASTAQAARDQSAAALTLADIKLSDAVIYAPDDGTILERNLDLGQVPSGGAVLFRLARQHKLEWLAQVDAAQLPKIKTNMTAEINSTSNIGTATKTIAGTVRSVSSQLNKNSRLANVRVLLEGVPELAVNAYVEGKIFIANTAAIVVPANCLVIKDGKTWLFRIKNNTAEQVLVSLGRRHEDKIEIINNISIGDVLAQEGAGFLNDGDKVTILTAPLKSAGAN